MTDSGPICDGVRETKQVSRPGGEVTAWVRDIVVSLAVSVFIIVFVYQPVKV